MRSDLKRRDWLALAAAGSSAYNTSRAVTRAEVNGLRLSSALVNVGDVDGTCVIVAELNGRFATDKELMLDVGENAMVVLRVDDIFGDGNDLSVVGQSFNMSRVVWINWLLIICIIVIVAAAAYARHRYKEKKTDQER